jgi:hypothetical protein
LLFGLFLHEQRISHRHQIDYLGSGLMMFGAGALMLALGQIGNSGGMTVIAVLAASGVVALLMLAARQNRFYHSGSGATGSLLLAASAGSPGAW